MSSPCFPALELILDDSAWQNYQEFESNAVFAEHCQSLSWSGLFTDHLANLDQGAVRVEVEQQAPMTDLAETSRRDVRIYAGTRLAAIASTIVSEQVLVAESWLRTLGNRPIGEMLEHRLGAVRTDIKYLAVVSGAPLFGSFSNEKALWGRRYRYEFDSGSLTITEIISDRIVQSLFANQ